MFNQAAGSCGPACEGESLIIEVIGKDHPEGHSFRIFDESDNEQQEWLENQVEVEDLEDSVLHVWPWKNQPERNIWLEIASEEGVPIRVPFLEGASPVKRELERQRHVILPVVPTTLISGVTINGENPCHHALSRPGFVYLFHEGKLWRELEIRIDDNGVTYYHDVPLQNYRNEDGEFDPGYRDVTGLGLKEIWLPARADAKWFSLHAAFSESQWPGPRINYLQKRPLVRVDRCTTINMELGEPKHEEGETLFVTTSFTNAFPASHLAPQRNRNHTAEQQYDRPENYLFDLKGDYASSVSQAAMAIHQRQEDPDPEDPVYEDERPEMTPLANCLNKTLKEVEASNSEASDESGKVFEWTESTQKAEDSTKDAKERLIGAIRLDDPIGQLRYLQQRRQVAAWFANAAVRRAKARPYFDSALLMNAAIVPFNVGGKPNPLHKYMSEINGQGRKELERSIAVSERKLAVQYAGAVQKDMLRTLRRFTTQQSLADLFTHSGYDYAGAFHFLTSLIQEVVKEPEECDVLAARVDRALDGGGKKWLRELCKARHGEPLYSLLFPRFRDGDLETPYEPSQEPEENEGDGHFRGTELATLENMELPEPDQLRTLDGLELSAITEQGIFATSFAASLRLGSQALMGVHGNLWSAINHASQTLTSNNRELKEIERELKELEAERVSIDQQRANAQSVATDRQQQLAHENRTAEQAKRDARAAARRYTEKEEDVKRKKANLGLQRQQLLSEAIHAQMRLYTGSVQQLRESMPALMGQVRLERLSKALQNDYYVIGVTGLEELPEGQRAVRMFGDITQLGDGNNKTVASTNKSRASAQGLPGDVADEVLVLAVPRTEEIAEVLAELRGAEQQYTKALEVLESLKRANIAEMPAAAAALAMRQVAEAETDLDEAHRRIKRFDTNLSAANDAINDAEGERANLAAENRAAQNARDSIESRRLYRVLNTPLLPVFVMLMELHNVSSISATAARDGRAQGRLNRTVGVVSAYTDFAVASGMLAERFLQNVAIVEKLSKHVLSRELGGAVGRALAELTGGPVSMGKLVGGVAGFLMLADGALDAYYSYRMGNAGAAIGYGVFAAGGLALGFASLAGPAGLLFLGATGWLAIGIVLAIAGSIIVAWFSDEPMEVWMRHGPFGPMAEKPFLKEPREAYHRLVSLLMGVSVTLEPNPLRGKALLGELENRDNDELAALSQANTRLRIESPIPGLFRGAGSEVEPHLQLVETKSERGHLLGMSDMSSRSEITIDEKESLKDYVLLEEENDSGTHVYLKTPITRSEESQRWMQMVSLVETWSYHWNVRIQLRIPMEDGAAPLVFPAPDPEDPVTYNENNDEHSVPDFQRKDRPFWFNERVYHHG
ncbi:hypothetical protein [Marinobacter sp.]|uniref:hypothetical protein n=1 Tax=Marinobacter sp. TaxID=50741 RepID=UPI003B51DFE9